VLTGREPYGWLDDGVCVSMGEARAPSDPGQPGPGLVIDVAEPIWEPTAGWQAASCLPGLG
jgi:hypothetical protein